MHAFTWFNRSLWRGRIEVHKCRRHFEHLTRRYISHSCTAWIFRYLRMLEWVCLQSVWELNRWLHLLYHLWGGVSNDLVHGLSLLTALMFWDRLLALKFTRVELILLFFFLISVILIQSFSHFFWLSSQWHILLYFFTALSQIRIFDLRNAVPMTWAR